MSSSTQYCNNDFESCPYRQQYEDSVLIDEFLVKLHDMKSLTEYRDTLNSVLDRMSELKSEQNHSMTCQETQTCIFKIILGRERLHGHLP